MSSRRLQFEGFFFDGRSSRKHPVSLELTPDGLVLRLPGEPRRIWPYDGLRMAPGTGKNHPVQLDHEVEDPGGARTEMVVVDQPGFQDSLERTAPGTPAKPWHVASHRQWMLITGLVILLPLFFYFLWRLAIPALAGRAAFWIPVEWEEKLGEQILASLAGKSRQPIDPGRQAAVDAIAKRLLDTVPGQPYKVRVFIQNKKWVNAIALPGGIIILYQGMINATDSPEELAGVLAHELQHVLLRHSTRGILHDFASSVLLSLMLGDSNQAMGAILKLAENLEGLRFSRSMEEAADAGGMEMMLAARIDPHGMVRVFETLNKEAENRKEPAAVSPSGDEETGKDGSDTWTGYLSTHPAGAGRVARLSQMMERNPVVPQPLLPGLDWSIMHRKTGKENP